MWLNNLWNWTKANDLPNWIIFIFTAIFWPITIFLWSKRKVRSINGLSISLARNTIHMEEVDKNQEYDAAIFQFINNTGKVVYLTNVSLRGCTKNFCPHPDASKDISDSGYELKFRKIATEGKYSLREITLHTGQVAQTCLALEGALPDEIVAFKPSLLRKIFHYKKYFSIIFIAMVGDKRKHVRCKY